MQVSKRAWMRFIMRHPTREKKAPSIGPLVVLMQVSKRGWIDVTTQRPTREKKTLTQASVHLSFSCKFPREDGSTSQRNGQRERKRIAAIVPPILPPTRLADTSVNDGSLSTLHVSTKHKDQTTKTNDNKNSCKNNHENTR